MLSINSRKKTKITLMFIIILSILTGCGSNVSTLEDFDVKEELEPVELTFYLYGDEPADKDEVLKVIENKCGLNVKLDFHWFGDNYLPKLNTALASNQKLDAFVCGVPSRELDIIKLTREGKVKDLSKLLPEYAPKLYSQLSKKEINMLKMDDKITVIPASQPSFRGIGVFINKELADKYNIKNINTFEEYDKVLKTMYEKEKGYIPGLVTEFDINLVFACAYDYVILDRVNNFVYKWDDPEMKIMPLEQIPEFKDNISQLNEWFKMVDFNFPKKGDKFATWVSFCRRGDKDGEKDFMGTKYYYFNLFKDRKLQRESELDRCFDSSFAFNINSKNVERALMFLDWVQGDKDNYNLVNYGIEGKHFSIDNDGLVQLESEYKSWRNEPFRNYKYETSDIEQIENYLIENAEYAPHEGFYPDYTNLEKELENRLNLFNQYIRSKVMMGTYDVSKTDEIIDKLMKTGSNKIVVQVQKQLDNWKKNNK